ncbi:succinate dehydrogenase (quinone) flavoprotein subunit, partial [Chlamydiales bacterium]|nr:succinate dehydrogenase (quinone) flavoprotein subunit [Chlamydiales bacterium]
EMCLAGPKIIDLLDRMGCPFNRTVEGNLDFRRFGGTLYHRTAFCGASTGQQLLYSLDEQVRRQEAKGNVEKFENHEFVRLVIDDEGITRGIILLDLFNLKLSFLKADSVVIATGGLGLIFKKSTNSTFCTGAANGRLYQQGMKIANGEFIQIPTAIPGHDKLRLMSESARGEGGRVWVPGDSTKKILAPNGEMIPCGKTGEPWYFLEELYPAFGNLVPRDIGAREILRICELGMGVNGEMEVYLDVSHLSKEKLHKLEAILEIYTKFTGDNPRKVPMRIFPAVHYSMGGGWVDWPAADDKDRFSRYRQMSNIPGCFNVGESDYQYHGANRLGANSLLSCIYAGLVVGDEVPRYLGSLKSSYDETHDKIYQQHLEIEKEKKEALLSSKGDENVFRLHDELSEWMVENVTVKRNNQDLERTYQKILEIKERFKNIQLDDQSSFANQSFIFANQFGPMLDLSLIITKGALLRDEFRGSHFKEGFTERNDKKWLKTTIAIYDKETKEPNIYYEPVDTRHFEPALRDYSQAKKIKPVIKNLPKEVKLPL